MPFSKDDKAEIALIVKEVLLTAGAQEASQAARQAAQTTGQQQTEQAGRQALQGSEQAETRGGERAELDNQNTAAAWHANQKALFDDFRIQTGRMNEALDSEINATKAYMEDLRSRRLTSLDEQQKFLSSLSTDYLEHRKQLHNQHTAHRDIATDATWDPGPGEESLKEKK